MEYSEKCFDTAEKIGSIELMAQIARDVCATNFFTGNWLKVVELSRRTLPSIEEHHREKDLYAGGTNVTEESAGIAVCVWGSWVSLRKAILLRRGSRMPGK